MNAKHTNPKRKRELLPAGCCIGGRPSLPLRVGVGAAELSVRGVDTSFPNPRRSLLAFGMHPTLEQLQAFDDGRLAEPDASTIEDHLATCSECLARVERGFSADSLLEMIRVVCQCDRAGDAPVLAGRVPTGYELIEPIGRGGMGVVFKARQRALGRLVAFKQIRAGLDADPNELARFQNEARAAARLTHPGIVRIFEVGQQDGLPYIAMELVEGGNLADRLRGGPLPPRDAAALIESLALAVHHSHEHGIVHRDLKPANILLTPEFVPRITDFGLVKLDDAIGPTQTGVLLGTPCYMAPEQIDAHDAGHRSIFTRWGPFCTSA